jgi:hypothetical protein
MLRQEVTGVLLVGAPFGEVLIIALMVLIGDEPGEKSR